MQSLNGLQSIILLDQLDRWRDGERPSAESYLEVVPELSSDRARLLDIVYQEVVLRREAGESVSLAEYQRRFPELERDLKLQFDLDEGLDWDAFDRTDLESIEPPHIDGYRIEGVLGQGAFGTVYKAWDLTLQRFVAVKLFSIGASADRIRTGDEYLEAQSIARLSHPNIVQVYAVGMCDQGAYFAQELVEDGTLVEFVTGQPQGPRQAAAFMARLADAIHYAHLCQVVHCDLKPANVLIRRHTERDSSQRLSLADFEPKVSDFGLARRLDTESVVESNHLAGTLQYMAPEQTGIEGCSTGPATDVYSLGAILYELLTGKPPFQNKSKLQVFLSIRRDMPVAPRRINAAIPADLEAICLQCLAKAPADRYASSSDFADDLRRFLRGYAPLAIRSNALGNFSRWVRRNPAIAALATALFFTGLSSLAVVTQKMLVAQRAEAAERSRADELDAALYRNQFRLAWSAYEDFNLARAEKLLAQTNPQRRSFEWNYLADRCSPKHRTLADDFASIRELSVSDDGRWIAVKCPVQSKGLGQIMTLLERKSGNKFFEQVSDNGFATPAEFCHAGTSIAAGMMIDGKGFVRIWSVPNGEVTSTIGPVEGVPIACRFSPSDESIAIVSWVATAAEFSFAKPSSLSPARRLVFEHWNIRSGERINTSMGDDTRRSLMPIAVLSDDLSKLAWVSHLDPLTFALSDTEKKSLAKHVVHIVNTADGQSMHSLVGHDGTVNGIVFSPDAKKLLSFDENGIGILWDMERGQAGQRMHSAGGAWLSADFSPDGKQLALSGRDHAISVWKTKSGDPIATHLGHSADVASIAFADRPLALISGDLIGSVFEWTVDPASTSTWKVSPAATCIALDERHNRILVADLKGLLKAYDVLKPGLPEGRELCSSVYTFALTPDGKQIAVVDLDGVIRIGDVDISVSLRPQSTIPRVVSGDARCFRFSPDGKTLAAVDRSTREVLWIDVASSSFRRVALPESAKANGMAFSSDGRRMAVSADDVAKVWIFEEDSRQRVLEIDTERPVPWLAFRPHSTELAIADQSKNWCLVWNSETGQRLKSIDGHKQRITALEYTPDGKRMITASDDRTLRVWDAESGDELLLVDGIQSWIRQLSMGRSGHRLVFYTTTDEVSNSEVTIFGRSVK